GLRVGAERPREGGPEAGQVRAALARVDVVREREHGLLIAVVVLERHLHHRVALARLEVEHLGVDRRLVLVHVLDELDDPARVVEDVLSIIALVLDRDLQTAIEERELAEAVGQRVERERRLLEDLRVRLEADDRPVLARLLARREFPLRDPELVALGPDAARPADLELEPLAERVDHRDADAVEAARDLVRRVLELAAGVEHGEDHLGRWLAALLVGIDGNPAPVVPHRAGAVRVQDTAEVVARPRERLVDRVVDDLIDEVVDPVRPGVPDVHRRALADRLQALEDLDVARGIGLGGHAATRSPARTSQRAPSAAGNAGSAVVRNTCSAAPSSARTLARPGASSSESASSSSRTGGVPVASATGSTSARRRASASSRC